MYNFVIFHFQTLIFVDSHYSCFRFEFFFTFQFQQIQQICNQYQRFYVITVITKYFK